jgi:hypothetical protein
LSINEILSRYWPGSPEEQIRRLAVGEEDFNGHRYCAYVAADEAISADQREAYLDKYEPAIRRTFLDAKHRKYPAMLAQATDLLEMTRSLKDLIDAFFWVRDIFADIDGITSGPAQGFFGTTHSLLQGFMEHYVPGYEADGLIQGYHADLEPYYPHTQMMEAKKLAQTVGEGPVRYAFETLEPAELFIHLFEEHGASPFLVAFEEYCERFGLYMPDHRLNLGAGERHRDAIGLVQNVLRGQDIDITALHENATRQRQACAGEVRQILADQVPEELTRFDKLFDWALFWGPALNDRGWAGIARQRIFELCRMIREALVTMGLIDDAADFIYFTVEDLAYIAAVDDIEEGRRIWQRRRLDHERCERLQPPQFLGAAPVQTVPSPALSKEAAGQDEVSADLADNVVTRIVGKRCVPGQCSGIAYKVDALEAADAAGEEHILSTSRGALFI